MMRIIKCISSIVAMVLTFASLWFGIRAFIADYFKIPSQSMEPTLCPGDEIVVNKLLFGARIYSNFRFNNDGNELESWRTNGIRKIRHNDIVVFNFPYHDGHISFVINHVLCKRVVALPGDSISIIDGRYHNNNYSGTLGVKGEQERLTALTDTLIFPPLLTTIPFDGHFTWTIRNLGPLYIPRRGDIVRITPAEATLYHRILEWETGKCISIDWNKNLVSANGTSFSRHTFTHNYYFMAGDNVLDSNDSRYWGLLPEEYVVGIVGYVYKK